jgi:hypothetical protein
MSVERVRLLMSDATPKKERSIHQPTLARNKTQSMTNIKLLFVSAPGCHPQGVLWKKTNTSQKKANPGSLTEIIKILIF